jgi:hypothetical protein
MCSMVGSGLIQTFIRSTCLSARPVSPYGAMEHVPVGEITGGKFLILLLLIWIRVKVGLCYHYLLQKEGIGTTDIMVT